MEEIDDLKPQSKLSVQQPEEVSEPSEQIVKRVRVKNTSLIEARQKVLAMSDMASTLINEMGKFDDTTMW